jgi:hypothetical protein
MEYSYYLNLLKVHQVPTEVAFCNSSRLHFLYIKTFTKYVSVWMPFVHIYLVFKQKWAQYCMFYAQEKELMQVFFFQELFFPWG